MTNNADIRKAHRIVKNAGSVMTREQIDFLRSMLPPLPAQKTLEEITADVRDAWVGARGNDWAGNSYDRDISIESWLSELYVHLKGLEDAPATEPAHPEFLETEADYENAPEGTVVAAVKASPAMKGGRWWESAPYIDRNAKTMAGESRRVLRWGVGE